MFIYQEDEIDPLDAFMTGIQEEVRRINKIEIKTGSGIGVNKTGKFNKIEIKTNSGLGVTKKTIDYF